MKDFQNNTPVFFLCQDLYLLIRIVYEDLAVHKSVKKLSKALVHHKNSKIVSFPKKQVYFPRNQVYYHFLVLNIIHYHQLNPILNDHTLTNE